MPAVRTRAEGVGREEAACQKHPTVVSSALGVCQRRATRRAVGATMFLPSTEARAPPDLEKGREKDSVVAGGTGAGMEGRAIYRPTAAVGHSNTRGLPPDMR